MEKQIKRGIVIVTCEATKDFVLDCVRSCVNSRYPILLVSNDNFDPRPALGLSGAANVLITDWNGFELAGIEKGMEFFDEFILLHDTVVVKDQKLFDLCFDFDGSVGLTKDLAYSYCGKFRTKILEQMALPRVYNYQEAVDQERPFGINYLKLEDKYMEIEPLGAGDHSIPIIEMHGRKGILLENSFLRKHKSHY